MTTLVAYAAFQARSLASGLRALVAGQLVSTLVARSNGATIERLTALVARHRLHAWGRSYSISETDELTLGYGSGVARWRGIWLLYNLRVDEGAKALLVVEVLSLTFLSRDRGVVDAFVREAQADSMQARETIDVHHRTDGAWHAIARRKRPIGTVFANAGLTRTLVDKVRWFLDNEAWYAARGLPYKLVILLHGAPGTGKSSLIQALASDFNRDLYCLDTLAALGPSVGRFANGMLAIEDIDTLGPLSRGRTGDGAPASAVTPLHGLLNTLDGLATPHGLITFVTTNHVDALDPALVRPCRIDLMAEVAALDFEAFAGMFASYFDGAVPGLAAEDYAPQSGARLQEIFMGAGSAAEAEAAVRRVCGRLAAAA